MTNSPKLRNRFFLKLLGIFLMAPIGGFVPVQAAAQSANEGGCYSYQGKCDKPALSPCAATEPQRGVYISPEFKQGIDWGGYHVTISGFSQFQPCGVGIMAKDVADAWNYLYPNAGLFYFKTPYISEINPVRLFGKPAKGYWVDFTSTYLDDLALYLITRYKFDCKQMKGPWCVPNSKVVEGTPWHVTLCEFPRPKPGDKGPDKRKCDLQTATDAWNSIKNSAWHFYIIDIPSDQCQRLGQCQSTDWHLVF